MASSWAVNAIDGNPVTSWQSAISGGGASEIVLKLDEVRRIRGVSIGVERGASEQIEVYASPDPRCWGVPIAQGTLTGTDLGEAPEVLRVAGDGREARFLRVVLSSSSGVVKVRELGVLVTAGIWTEVIGPAFPTLRFDAQLEADLPGDPKDPVTYALVAGPDGASVSAEGLLSWTAPASAPTGLQQFEVTATSSIANVTLHRSLEIELRPRKVVAQIDIEPGVGGEILLTETDDPELDGLVFTIPPNGGDHVEVWLLSTSLDAPASDFHPFGPAFMIVGASVPVTVQGSAALLARVRGEGTDPRASVAVALSAPAADYALQGEGRREISVVGGTCSDGGSGDPAPRHEILSKHLEPDALAQLMRHDGACYELEKAPFVARYWDNEHRPRAEILALMEDAVNAAERTRTTMNRTGCAPLTDEVELLIVPVNVSGVAPSSGRIVLLNRALSPEEMRVTVYHELTHTIHQRTVLWENESAYFDDRGEGRWALEGLAVFNEDEIDNTNAWQRRYLNLEDGFPALDKKTVEFGLRTSQLIHPYLQFTFFKALKARKGFDVCAYLNRRVNASSAYAAIDALVGGEKERHKEYAEFVATWLLPALVDKSSRIDDDDILPDALPEMRDRVIIPDQGLPGCGNLSSVVEVPMGTVSGGAGLRFVCAVPATKSHRYRVQLVAPEEDATMLVFDAEGNELGAAEPKEEFKLPEGTTEFSIAVGLHQGPRAVGLGEAKPVRVRVDSGDVTFAFEPSTDAESPVDQTHPAILEGDNDKAGVRYFDASLAPVGWAPNGEFYEGDYPSGVLVGNIDWRGARGDVLTWNGPHGRSAATLVYGGGGARPTNLGRGYVNVPATNLLTHRGTAVYSKGALLHDFAGAGYVSGAAVRYVFDPESMSEKRSLLAVTTKYGESVDRLWSVALDAEPPLAVELGVVALPDGYVWESARRANSYFFNASATRCSSALPVRSQYTETTRTDSSMNGSGSSTTNAYDVTYSSQVVAHVDWLGSQQARVSFEPEVFGEAHGQSHMTFEQQGEDPHFSPLQYASNGVYTMRVSGVPVGIDYDGDQEVRLVASTQYRSTSELFDREDFSLNASEAMRATEAFETQETTTYQSRSFSLMDTQRQTRSLSFHMVDSSNADFREDVQSTEQHLIFADLRSQTFGYLTIETSSSLTASGTLASPGVIPSALEVSRQHRLSFGGREVAFGVAHQTDSGTYPVNVATLQRAGLYYDSGTSSESRDIVWTGGRGTVVLESGLALNRSGQGPIQVLPEVAIARRGVEVVSVEFLDLASYDFARDVFAPSLKTYVAVPGNEAPPALFQLEGENLRLRSLGIF
ncbi:MAG: discoidin domain-containing protein [Deltaproteobacteria bacterium]|nr:discoidin domain-containing protein [Deltaproteobacteria bacterium]